jgi:hypothetical protein
VLAARREALEERELLSSLEERELLSRHDLPMPDCIIGQPDEVSLRPRTLVA